MAIIIMIILSFILFRLCHLFRDLIILIYAIEGKRDLYPEPCPIGCMNVQLFLRGVTISLIIIIVIVVTTIIIHLSCILYAVIVFAV